MATMGECMSDAVVTGASIDVKYTQKAKEVLE